MGLELGLQDSTLPDNIFAKKTVRTLVAVLLLAGLLCLFATALYFTFTSKYPGANDYYSRWMGARAIFLEHENPYSSEVTQEIQIGMYGKTVEKDGDQVAFAYPLYTVYTIGPMAFLPYPQAQALWQAILQFSIIAATVLCSRFMGLKPRPLALASLVLWSVLFYPNLRGFILGQYAIVVFLFFVASLLALQKRRDSLAGFLLAWTTIKPQMVVFLIPYLLLWAILQRRWRFVVAFGATLLALVVSAMLLVPGWLGDFLIATVEYQQYTQAAYDGKPTLKHLTDFLFGSFGSEAYLALAVILSVGLLATWYNSLRRAPAGFETAVALIAIVSILFPFDQATTNQILLLLPITLIIKAVIGVRLGRLWVLLFQLLLLFVPWVFFLSTFVGNMEHTLQFALLPLPVLLITAVLYLKDSREIISGVKVALK